MKTMIVGINYNTDGTRYINEITYKTFIDAIELCSLADCCKSRNDEVYTIDINPSHKDFIQEIVLHGCRM